MHLTGFAHLLTGPLRTIFAFGQPGYDLTPAEKRIKFLYENLDKMKPWEWDHDSYGPENQDMIGFFYPEDIENIKTLNKFEIELSQRTKPK